MRQPCCFCVWAHNTISNGSAECKCCSTAFIHWCVLNLRGKGNTGKNIGKQASKSLVVTEVLHRALISLMGQFLTALEFQSNLEMGRIYFFSAIHFQMFIQELSAASNSKNEIVISNALQEKCPSRKLFSEKLLSSHICHREMAAFLDSLTDTGLGECTDCPGLFQEHTVMWGACSPQLNQGRLQRLLWQSG